MVLVVLLVLVRLAMKGSSAVLLELVLWPSNAEGGDGDVESVASDFARDARCSNMSDVTKTI